MFVILIFLILLSYLLYSQRQVKEHFQTIPNTYDTQSVDVPLKQDVYMNFLDTLNTNYKHMDTLENKSLDEAFATVPGDGKEIFASSLFVKEEPSIDFVDKSKNDCLYKANHISEYTNPMFYLSETKYFPPRWIVKTYKDIPLPKHTNLKQWQNMFNCCKLN